MANRADFCVGYFNLRGWKAIDYHVEQWAGGEHSHSYRISFHDVSGSELCHIAVDPAPKPVYVKGEMYVRAGNQKRKLTAREAVEFQKQRWP